MIGTMLCVVRGTVEKVAATLLDIGGKVLETATILSYLGVTTLHVEPTYSRFGGMCYCG